MIKIKSKISKKIFIRVFSVGLVAMLVTGALSIFMSISIMQKRAIQDSKSINEQIMKQMDYVFQNIIDLSINTSLNDELGRMIMTYQNEVKHSEIDKRKIAIFLSSLMSQNRNLSNIVIKTDEGQVYEALLSSNDEAPIFESSWYKAYKKNNYPRYFSKPYSVNIANKYVQYYYFITRYNDNNGVKGDIILFINYDSIQFALNSVNKYFDSYLLLNRDNNPFYPEIKGPKENINLGKVAPFLDKIYFNYEFTVKDLYGYNLVRISEKSGWKLVSYVSNKALLKSYMIIIIVNICVALLFFLLIAVMLLPLLSNIVKPIYSLAQKMSDVSKGNLEITTNIKTGDEIEELSNTFNYMVKKLKNYVEALLEKEKTEQKMKYGLLISQIDPHFIYNTMNTVNYLARKNRNNDVVTVNNALIKILQDRLRVNDIEVFDTVRKEVEMVEKYLVIQKYRYSENVGISWDIDEELLDLEIPKNIIQPLVENSLIHGVHANVDEEMVPLGGNIKIVIKGEEDSILIKVMDNGAGIPAEKLESINTWNKSAEPSERGRHIGLNNIRERLHYLYGDLQIMKIESKVGEGTSISVIIHMK